MPKNSLLLLPPRQIWGYYQCEIKTGGICAQIGVRDIVTNNNDPLSRYFFTLYWRLEAFEHKWVNSNGKLPPRQQDAQANEA